VTDLVRERMNATGPKKILACDGGGILGLMSVEILAKLEADLRERSGNPDFVLADFFDFVSGTSTGAIIATCLATGMSTGQIRSFYVQSGAMMFEPSGLTKRLRYSYNDEPLAKILRTEINRALGYGDGAPPATLGNENLRCLLMMVMRNHTTDSPWPVSNNPDAYYNNRSRVDCNLNLPLWQLVRASTAAPTFFPPEMVVFAEGTPKEYSFLYVDGGLTTYNNPAFLSFQMATAAPYAINWKTGVDDLLIVSVGTGNAPRARPGLKPGDLWVLDHAKNIPSALMNAASAGWDMTCRMLGDCRFGAPIDREFGDGVTKPGGKDNWAGPKQFTYVRYDPDVTAAGLQALGLADIKPEAVQVMDSVEFIRDIQRVGEAYSRHVSLDHFSQFVPESAQPGA
jgi:predicted acylesterase/phospholipase RssA